MEKSIGEKIKDIRVKNGINIQNNQEENLAEKIKKVGELYAAENRGKFAGSQVGKIVTKEIPMSIVRKANINQDKFLVVGSIGKGQFAEVPWISIFNKKITKSATKGIYVVYLYTADMKGVYLSLNQGYTYFKEKFVGKKSKDEIEKMSETIRNLIFIPENMKTYDIDLRATKALGKGYMAGHIAGKYYDLKNMPDENTLVLDLLELLEVYDEINLLIRNRTPEQFYDYIMAEKRGLIDSYNEVNSTMQTETGQNIELEMELEDRPSEKQSPVVDKGGNKIFLRNAKVAVKSLELAKFKCEINDSHKTFISKASSNPYVESHHIIPISKSNLFGYSIDVIANVCSLCPNCHRAIHSATDELKRDMLIKLYENRKNRLEKSGIYITIEQLMDFYGIE